jgi:predicted DNA-binding transcriptional regulator YafY
MPITSNAFRMRAALDIHREIAKGTYPNATLLAQKLRVSPKTARKYVTLLADIFGTNPLYDKFRHGYYYDDMGRAALIPRLREDEVAAVFLMEQAARHLAGSPVQKVLESVLGKLSMMLPSGCDITMGDLSDALSLRMDRASAVNDDCETLNLLYDALVKQQRVSCLYAGRERAEPTRRKIDPIHLTRCEGQWYLVAYCHLRNGMRTFVPARMTEVKALKETFARPKDFDPQRHFRTAFGIATDNNVHEARLRFCKNVAGLIRERQWHPTQILEDVDGAVRLTMTCSHGPELAAWILSWGEQVVVESPQALADLVAKRHLLAARQAR